MTKVRLTKNMQDRLLRLGRASGGPPPEPSRFIRDVDCGGPSTLAHLFHKGYVERTFDYGPRGGEWVHYRPNEAGWAEIARLKERRLTAQTRGAIDSALIAARDAGRIVRIFTGETEYRGVPGQVYRTAAFDSKLVLPIGARTIPLEAITRVIPA